MEMRHKALAATVTGDAAGEFEALVSVFNNVDSHGDRIVKGAFSRSLAKWRASGDPIPVVWSHKHDDPSAHIGVVEAGDAEETERGLLVRGTLDVGDNPQARQVHMLMKRRSLREFSFGYTVPTGGERRASDGVNELTEVDLIELGPCLKGANPATELMAVKALGEADDPSLDRLRQRARDVVFNTLMGGR